MLQLLALLGLSLAVCSAHMPVQLLEEPEETSSFSQRIFISDGSPQLLSSMHYPMEDTSEMDQPLFGMSRSSNGDWDSWMDSQFDALNAMNQALLGRRGGCGGHMRQQSFGGPVLVQGVPTMTTPSVVMQRLAAARISNALLKALIGNNMDISPETEQVAMPRPMTASILDISSANDMRGNQDEAAIPQAKPSQMAEDILAWHQNQRMLAKADEDEEAEAEADATETTQDEELILLPSAFRGPEDQALMNDSAGPASSINWSLMNDDGSTNWGLVVFIVQTTACISVWAGLMATLFYYRFRRAAISRSRQQFAAAADSNLMAPLMYEPIAKGDHTAQLYNDLYPVEDAKQHADDKQYVAIQYVPLKSEV